MGSKPADEELEAAQPAIQPAAPPAISSAEAEASAPSASLRGGSTYLTQFEARLLVAMGLRPCLQPASRRWSLCSAQPLGWCTAQEGAPFKDGWREFLSSLPWTSYVLVALALLDVCLVWAYCGWSVNRPGGSIEESLHIALALAV